MRPAGCRVASEPSSPAIPSANGSWPCSSIGTRSRRRRGPSWVSSPVAPPSACSAGARARRASTGWSSTPPTTCPSGPTSSSWCSRGRPTWICSRPPSSGIVRCVCGRFRSWTGSSWLSRWRTWPCRERDRGTWPSSPSAGSRRSSFRIRTRPRTIKKRTPASSRASARRRSRSNARSPPRRSPSGSLGWRTIRTGERRCPPPLAPGRSRTPLAVSTDVVEGAAR